MAFATTTDPPEVGVAICGFRLTGKSSLQCQGGIGRDGLYSFTLEATASLSLGYLKDIAQLIMELFHESIPVVVGELGETNSIDPTVADQAQKNVRSVWS